MGLETGSYIKDLVPTNPQGTDPKSQGDDHLRLIKTVLANQFSGFTEGVPITVPESKINNIGPSFKNILINGEVTRINQRVVANWAAVANGAYGYDRWKKIDASNMTQIVEAGNFLPSTIYTLSGVGVTTEQLTSPASGNWTLPSIPITATNVQLEEGPVATPFELRPIGTELALCQRYYCKSYPLAGLPGLTQPSGAIFTAANGLGSAEFAIQFKTSMRATPTLVIYSPVTGAAGVFRNDSGAADVTANVANQGEYGARVYGAAPANVSVSLHFTASAEL
jgi:hypothetical protein